MVVDAHGLGRTSSCAFFLSAPSSPFPSSSPFPTSSPMPSSSPSPFPSSPSSLPSSPSPFPSSLSPPLRLGARGTEAKWYDGREERESAARERNVSRHLHTVYEGFPAQTQSTRREGKEMLRESSRERRRSLHVYRAGTPSQGLANMVHGPSPFLRLLPHPCSLCPSNSTSPGNFPVSDPFCGEQATERRDDFCLFSPLATRGQPHQSPWVYEKRERLYVSSISVETERMRISPLLALSQPSRSSTPPSLPSFVRRRTKSPSCSASRQAENHPAAASGRSLPGGGVSREEEKREKHRSSFSRLFSQSQRTLRPRSQSCFSSFPSSSSSVSSCVASGPPGFSFPVLSLRSRQTARQTHALFSLLSNFALFCHPFGDSPAGDVLAALLRDGPGRGESFARALFVEEISTELLGCYLSAPHHPPVCSCPSGAGRPSPVSRAELDDRGRSRGKREQGDAREPEAAGNSCKEKRRDKSRRDRGLERPEVGRDAPRVRAVSTAAIMHRFLASSRLVNLAVSGAEEETPRKQEMGEREPNSSTQPGTEANDGNTLRGCAQAEKREPRAHALGDSAREAGTSESPVHDLQTLQHGKPGEAGRKRFEAGLRRNALPLSEAAAGDRNMHAERQRPNRLRGSPGKRIHHPLCASQTPRDRLFYTTVGTGPEHVVVIHGICMSGSFFSDVLSCFLDASVGSSPAWKEESASVNPSAQSHPPPACVASSACARARRSSRRAKTSAAKRETQSLPPSFSPASAECGTRRCPSRENFAGPSPGAEKASGAGDERVREEKGHRRKDSKRREKHTHSPLDPALFTFYNVDLVGFGRSASIYSPTDYSRREQAIRVVQDIIFANKLPAVHLVGHSFGSLVAAEVARLLPLGSVKSVLLLAPAYFESTRQAMQILTATHFPAAHSIAHPIVAFFILKIGRLLRPVLEPIFNIVVPKDELPQLSVADLFSIDPDAMVGTILSIVNERLEETLQTLQDRRIRVTIVHGTGDGVIPIRQSQVLAERYSNVQLRPVKDFVHHFPSSHSRFTAHLLHQEVLRYREASSVRTCMRSHSVAAAVGSAADPALALCSRHSLYRGLACAESL
uniref:Hydrolase, alpha/beta fold family protein n=1 Tax=Neospora caninum (strain Liverpool) TaxID=572307 RepID=A0A0F7UG09_NEOCL|nr:TPA: hydrolase, alpha/beta fold family protein [Neospora caninum Liverpool]